jgi:hypothetical protein
VVIYCSIHMFLVWGIIESNNTEPVVHKVSCSCHFCFLGSPRICWRFVRECRLHILGSVIHQMVMETNPSFCPCVPQTTNPAMLEFKSANVMDEWLALLRIYEVPGSNLDLEVSCCDRGYYEFYDRLVPWSFPSKSFLVHQSSYHL